MKKKKPNEYIQQGYTLVPETTGVILDSIYHHQEKQELLIVFATGKRLRFKPLEETIENNTVAL